MNNQDAIATQESVATKFDNAAAELEAAAAHLRIAAQHYREGEVPRGCAHAFAAYGHVRTGQTLIDENAMAHAAKAQR